MSKKPIRLLIAVLAIVVAGVAVAALSGDDAPATVTDTRHGDVEFAEGEMGRILNAAAAATDQTSPDELVAEGRRIFRDKSLYEDGESCQTCHTEGSASADLGMIPHRQDTSKPVSPTNFNGPRDPPALWGLAKTAPYFWNGDVPDLRSALIRPVKGHMKEFVPGGATVPGVDCTSDSTECETRAGRVAAALEAYVKTLDPPTTAFDQGRMSAAALRGEQLFQGKGGCIACHGGPLFTDNRIHDTGVPQVPRFVFPGAGELPANDPGAGPPTPPPACRVQPLPEGCQPTPGPFINTPQLRDLRNTAPYMHNGRFQTLRQVIDFYNTQSLVAPLNLTPSEVSDLVAYMEEL